MGRPKSPRHGSQQDRRSQDLKGLLAEGRRLIDAQHYEEAVVLLRSGLAGRANHPGLNLQLGRALLMSKRGAEARVPLRKAMSGPNIRADALYQLARAEFQTGRLLRAAAAFRLCLKMRPEWVDARVRFSEALLRLGKAEQALKEASEAISLDPDFANAYRISGLANATQHRFLEAAAAFETWGRLQAKNGKPELYRARVLRLAGEPAAALEAAQSAHARNPASLRTSLLMGKLALAMGDNGQAGDILQIAVRRHPKNAAAHALLAKALLQRQHQQTEIWSSPAPAEPGPAQNSASTPQDAVLLSPRPTAASNHFVMRRPRALNIGLIENLGIIRALILRDLRVRYRSDSIGFVLEFLRPFIVIMAHYYLFLLIKKPMPANIPIFTFVIAGFPVWFAFNGAFLGATNAGNAPGRATLLPKVTTFHLQFARATWTWLLNLIICLFGSIPLLFLGVEARTADLNSTLLIFILAGAMGFGFGLVAEQLSEPWPMSKIIVKLMMWAIFVTSGQYISITSVRRTFAEILWFNPLLHLVEYERHAFDPGYPIALVTLIYPAAIAVALLMLALMGMRATRQAAIA